MASSSELIANPWKSINPIKKLSGADASPVADYSKGALLDTDGKPFVFDVVRQAEKLVLNENTSKEYLPINGLPEFLKVSRRLVFGSQGMHDEKIVTVQTLAATGALRLSAEILHRFFPEADVYFSGKTWPNHETIFAQVGYQRMSASTEQRLGLSYEDESDQYLSSCFPSNVQQSNQDTGRLLRYRYIDSTKHTLDLTGMLEDLRQAKEGSVILLQACVHNPTGIQPTQDQWCQIRDVCLSRRLIPLFDLAYQGLASGQPEEDVRPIRLFFEAGLPVIVAQSLCKIMSLESERVGALHIVTDHKNHADAVMSQLQVIIRHLYSNPPAHGARIAVKVLSDNELLTQWNQQLRSLVDRIESIRKELHNALTTNNVPGDWDFILHQKGFFCCLCLQHEEVYRLRERHGINLVEFGRLNLTALSRERISKLVQALKALREN